MSTQTKSSGGGGGGGRTKSSANKTTASAVVHAETNNTTIISNKKHNDQPKTEKEKPHVKPTPEQIRIAQITEIKSGTEDPKLREKVDQLMETTQRSEDDASYALHICDNDVERAVIYLLEQLEVDALTTKSKKKKNKSSATATDGTAGEDEFGEATTTGINNVGGSGASNAFNDNRDRSRGRGASNRGGSASGRGSGRGGQRSGAGGNDRGGNEGGMDRRGGGGGPRRGGFGGNRGGRGGRMGPRGQGYRDQNHRNNYRINNQETQEIDSWDSSQVNSTDIITNKTEETWGDWDNEEYTGSLSDTKVFTPSTANQGTVPNPSDLSAPPGLEQQILNPPVQGEVQVQQYSTTVVSSSATAAAINNGVQYPELHMGTTAAQQLRDALAMPQLTQQTSLSAEQSQYFNTLSSQNASAYSTSVQYPYGDQVVSSQQTPTNVRQQQQQQQGRTRARAPPPSKIPASAVEMPGAPDSLNVYLDVQFGGLDYNAEENYDVDKYAGSLDASSHVPNADVSEYQTNKTGVVQKGSQSALVTGGLQSSQLIQNTDPIQSGQGDGYQQRNAASSLNNSMSNASGQTALDQLNKTSDPYGTANSSAGAASGYQNLPYTANKASSGYQTAAPTGYNNSGYNSSQVTSNNNYQTSNSNYNTYNQNSYQQNQQAQSNQQQQNSSNNSVVTNSQNVPVNNGANGSNNSSNYMSNQYPVNQSAFPSQPNAYQNQNVYGNTGLSNSTEYSGSINTLTSKLKGATGTFDSSSNVVSSVTSSVSNTAITTSSINSPSLVLTNAKSSTSAGAMKTVSGTSSGVVTASGGNNGTGAIQTIQTINSSNVGGSSVSGGVGVSSTGSNHNATGTVGVGGATSGNGANSNVVQNIPMVSSYIQPSLQFYTQQQPYVHFEDMQLVQPRMTAMPGYYEFQTPTSLSAAGVRNDGTAATNLGSVAYPTMADGRFTRTDNNSSPVGNVQSQQTGSGGQMVNIPPYAYFYGANVMPSGFQQYPQIFSQIPGTNANAGQFAKQSYSSGYGSTGYDALTQTAPDYNKTAYQSAAGIGQQTKGHSVSNNQTGTSSDIGSSMYNKSHVALNKVNSYDKQSFHSGTPPPFNLAGSQTAGSQTQPYGQHLYIPSMSAPHHNMNMHQQIHQDTNSTGQRQPSNNQSKSGTKPGYSSPYWASQN